MRLVLPWIQAIFFLVFCSRLEAQAELSLTLPRDDFDLRANKTIYLPVLRQGAENWEKIADPRTKVLLARFLIKSINDRHIQMKDWPDATNRVREAIGLAHELELYDEAQNLRVFEFGLDPPDNPEGLLSAWKQFHQEELIRIQNLRKPYLFARINSLMAILYYQHGDMGKAIRLGMDAYGQLKRSTDAPPGLRLAVLGQVAIMLDTGGFGQRAFQIYQELNQLAKELGSDDNRSIVLYNMAGYHLDSVHPTDWDKAEPLLQESLELAQKYSDAVGIGMARQAQARLARNRQQWKVVLERAGETVKIFSSLDNPPGLSDAYALLLEAEAKLGNSAAASRYMKLFTASYDQTRLESAHKLLQLQSLLAESQGAYAEAMTLLRKAVESEKVYDHAQRSENHAQLIANLGLEVEEERRKNLEAANLQQAQQLAAARRQQQLSIGIMVLLAVLLVTTINQVRKSAEIRRAKIKMQTILDTIDEGIATLDHTLCIEPGYSSHFPILLQWDKELKGEKLENILWARSDLKSEQRSMATEALRSILGEDRLAWDLNAHNLPREMILETPEKRQLALLWTPILNPSSQVERVILAVHDQSESLRLHKEAQDALEEGRQMMTRLRNLLRFPGSRGKEFLNDLREWLAAEVPDLKRLHTLKGVARGLQLGDVSEACHALESALNKGSDEATVARQELKKVYEAYQQLSEFSRHTESASAIRSLGGLLEPLLSLFCDQLKKQGLVLDRLSVDDAWLAWPESWHRPLRNTLLHALNNAVDHGYVLPKQRSGWTHPVRFHISAKVEGPHLHLWIADEGAGLNMEALTKLAQSRGFIPGAGQTVADVVFEEGLSTAGSVSESSGRGMGMAAIRDEMMHLGGTANMLPNPTGQGAALRITWAAASLHALDRAG